MLMGSGSEFERDLPFGVFVDALDDYVASQMLDADETDEEWLSDLAGVLPALQRGDRSVVPAAGDERHRAHRSVRRLLQVLAEREPLVLVLDDLHWSDPASAELIASLLRRDMAAPVLLALAYRSGREPARLTAALGRPAWRSSSWASSARRNARSSPAKSFQSRSERRFSGKAAATPSTRSSWLELGQRRHRAHRRNVWQDLKAFRVR